jgi:hypothetical protein
MEMVELSIGILGAWLGGGIGWAWMERVKGEVKQTKVMAGWLALVAVVGVGVAAFAGAGWVVWVMWLAGVTLGGALGARGGGGEKAGRWKVLGAIVIPALALGWHLAYLARMSDALAEACKSEGKMVMSACGADWERRGDGKHELLSLALIGIIEIRTSGAQGQTETAQLTGLEELRNKVMGTDCRLVGEAHDWHDLCKAFFAQSVVSQGQGDWPGAAKWLSAAMGAIDQGVAQKGMNPTYVEDMKQVSVLAALVIPKLTRVEELDGLMPGPEATVVLGAARGLAREQGEQALDDGKAARRRPIYQADFAMQRIHNRTLNGWDRDSRIHWLGDVWCDWQMSWTDQERPLVEMLAWRRCLAVLAGMGKWRLEKGGLADSVEELTGAYGVGEENRGLKEAVVTMEKKGHLVMVKARPATGMKEWVGMGKGARKKWDVGLEGEF